MKCPAAAAVSVAALLIVLSIPWQVQAATGLVSGLMPSELRCESWATPQNVDVPRPRLSWRVDASEPGQSPQAFQVLVASSRERLAKDQADVWDSGKVAASGLPQVEYAGVPLVSGQQYFWKVRAWDQTGTASAWSEPAVWSMGLLGPQDWKADWIMGPYAPARSAAVLGYHALPVQDPREVKWVQIDLGRSMPIESVTLHSLDHEVAGFGFPVRFKITASDEPNFGTSDTVTDQTADDFPNPGHTAPAFKPTAPLTGRFVRVTATRLFRRTQGDHTYCFALAELEVRSGGKVVSLNAPVTAKDAVEGYGWAKKQLTDGQGMIDDPAAATSNGLIRTMPIFRKQFKAAKPLSRAVVHVCGLGQYELHVNGDTATTAVLEPGWTDYRKTCLYQSYDITEKLRAGDNALGVMLGNGMYNVRKTEGRYTKFEGSMGVPKLIAQIQLDYQDGTSETIGSDDTWKVGGGPITFSSPYGGEDYDARLELPAWDQPANEAASGQTDLWKDAIRTQGPGGELTGLSRAAPPIEIAQTLKPQAVTHPRLDVWVYDLGQNCAQIPEMTVKGAAGATVRLTPGELLNADGTVSQESSGSPVYFNYVLKGGSPETWMPRFSYYGYRYVQVSGAVPAGSPNPSRLPEIQRLAGKFITSSSPIVGEFACSNPLLTRTAEIIRWSMRSNMVSVLTDCPHREKLGWLEQSHLVGPSLMYNFDIHALYAKICGDTRDSQLDSGLVPSIAPEYAVFGGGFRDSPEWGSACVLLPWQLYEWYGDTTVLKIQYATMKRYVAYLGTRAQNHILSHGLGDWYDLGPRPPGEAQLTPRSLTATAFYYRDLIVLQRTAEVLGQTQDAADAGRLADSVKQAFVAKFYDATTHNFATSSQTSNAIPLVVGLAPEQDRAAIIDNLVADIRKRNNGLTAGDVGYRYLLRALADGGRSDVIFDMNSTSDKPGYGMIIAKGATSLTEAWDARRDSSQNHFMLGHIMEWLYSDLAGIRQEHDTIAFQHIVFRPTPAGDITWARARFESPRGVIQSEWKINNDQFDYEIVVPPGAPAKVALPQNYGKTVTLDGTPIAPGPITESGRVVVSVDPGKHRLTASHR